MRSESTWRAECVGEIEVRMISNFIVNTVNLICLLDSQAEVLSRQFR